MLAVLIVLVIWLVLTLGAFLFCTDDFFELFLCFSAAAFVALLSIVCCYYGGISVHG